MACYGVNIIKEAIQWFVTHSSEEYGQREKFWWDPQKSKKPQRLQDEDHLKDDKNLA